MLEQTFREWSFDAFFDDSSRRSNRWRLEAASARGRGEKVRKRKAPTDRRHGGQGFVSEDRTKRNNSFSGKKLRRLG
jgi:hypothetical protein